MYRRYKPIPAFRHGFDVPIGVGLTERFPEHRNGAVEVSLLDDRVVPDFFEQPFFFDEVSGVFNEHPQEREHPGGERDALAVAKQPVFSEIERAPAELTCRLWHGCTQAGDFGAF